MDKDQLELVATDDLLEELERRYHWFVFAGKEYGDDAKPVRYRTRGDLHASLGAAFVLQSHLHDEIEGE